jgi:sugar-1,4-lactone oxidase-like protein
MPGSDTGYIFRNWDRSLACHPKRFFQPKTEEEVIEIVRNVSREGGTVRTFGAGHSWSPVAITDGTLLNLDNLNRIVSVDAEKKQVTVQAGIRLKELNALLPKHGLAMANLGSISEQSIAGAISTGTHGTGIRFGSLSTQIVAMNLVTGAGKVLQLSLDRQPEMMAAARLSLGALGVITQVTIQCVESFNLSLHAELRPFDEVLDGLDTLNRENERVRLYWLPGTDAIYVMTLNHTDQAPTPQQPILEWFNNIFLRRAFLAFLFEAGYRLPGLIEKINQFNAKVGFLKEKRVARSDRLLNVPDIPRHQESESAVPIERTAEAVRLTRKIIKENNYKVSVPVEMRFVAADELMLSPAYHHAVCFVGAYTYSLVFANPYYKGFDLAMKSLGGRPHWGKVLSLTTAEANQFYPMFQRFNEIRKELDPAGIFANKFIRDLFG